MIKKNQVVKWAVMLWLQTGCFFINLSAGHGKGKWKYSKGIFKIVKEMKISK